MTIFERDTPFIIQDKYIQGLFTLVKSNKGKINQIIALFTLFCCDPAFIVIYALSGKMLSLKTLPV